MSEKITKKKIKKQQDYDENSIQELEFPENVQRRPTMYIGNTGILGNNHLVEEIIDNSVDEALNGYGNLIKIEISNKKGYCKVTDRGRGIPPKAIEKAATKLHSSGKFDKGDYSISAGLNGVKYSAPKTI